MERREHRAPRGQHRDAPRTRPDYSVATAGAAAGGRRNSKGVSTSNDAGRNAIRFHFSESAPHYTVYADTLTLPARRRTSRGPLHASASAEHYIHFTIYIHYTKHGRRWLGRRDLFDSDAPASLRCDLIEQLFHDTIRDPYQG